MSAKDDLEELSDEKLAWLSSVYTAAVAKAVRESAQQALGYLLNQCSASNDPTVRSAYMVYIERQNLMKMFERKE